MVLEGRLREALARLNPHAARRARRKTPSASSRGPEGPTLVAQQPRRSTACWSTACRWSTPRPTAPSPGDLARVLDYENPDNNDWLAVNQFTVVEGTATSAAADVVLFVNGLPLAVIELKNAADENATIWSAFNQLQTYKEQIPSLFPYNAALVISDGLQARVGTLTADQEWFLPWRTIDGEEMADDRLSELQVLLEGVFERRRFLDLIRYFIVFEDDGGGVLVKKMAGYHQYPRRQRGARGDAARLCAPARRLTLGEMRGVYWTRPEEGGAARRPARRRGVAHAGVGQEPDHGVLRGQDHPAPGHGQPDAGGAHRPQRPGQPALRQLLTLATICCARRRCRPRAATTCAS